MEFVAGAAVSALVSTGIGAVTRALTGKKGDAPTSNVTAYTPTNIDLLSQAPDPGGAHVGVFGHRRLGGKVVFSGKTGGKTYLVIEIAGAPVVGINGVFINNGAATINGSGDVTNAPWSSSINIALYTGAQTTVDSVMAAAWPNWTSQYVGKQITYARIRIDPSVVSASVYTAGVPDFTFDVSGFACYDPRNGSHVLGTPSTWTYSSNAAIINANYLIHRLGHNLPTDRVDWTSVTAAANICDQSVTLKSGASEARYTAALTWATNERHETVLDRIGQAHAGGAYFIGKKYLIRSGVWTATSAAFTTSDYAENGLSFSETPPIAQLCNGVRGTFTSPLHNYENRDFPAWQDATALAVDGAEYWIDLQLDAVTSPTQAQRLAKIAFNKARNGFTATVDLQFSAFETTAEDTITITDDLAGFSATSFRVLEDSLSADFVCRLSLVREDSTYYDWTAATDEQDFTSVSPVLGEGGDVGTPGVIMIDTNATVNQLIIKAEITPPGSGNAASLSLTYNGSTTTYSAALQTTGTLETTAGGIASARPTSAKATDAGGVIGVIGSIVPTLISIDNQAAATNSNALNIILPTPAAPRLLASFSGAAQLFVPQVGGSRSIKMRLYENSTNDSSTASLVDTQTNNGVTFSRTGSAGTVKWYWARTYDDGNNVMSGFSNPTLVVF